MMFIWLFKVPVRVTFNEKVHILIDKLLPYECTVSLFLSWSQLKCINWLHAPPGNLSSHCLGVTAVSWPSFLKVNLDEWLPQFIFYYIMNVTGNTYRLQSSNRRVRKMDHLMTKNDNSFERLKDMQEKKVGLGVGPVWQVELNPHCCNPVLEYKKNKQAFVHISLYTFNCI